MGNATTENIWGERKLTEGKTEFISLGNLRLWLILKDSDIWIGYLHVDSRETKYTKSAPPPENLEWLRWATKKNTQKIRLAPVFPDLPLVVTSEYLLKISSDTEIPIFTRIPVWVRINLPDKDYLLTEIPTVKLSRTWFGTPLEGELCYHATTKARRHLSEVELKSYVVNCSIVISNKSNDDLNFENFCYRVERLSIYQHDRELWADETQIIYQGEDLNSDVIMTGKLPEGIDKKILLSKPRKEIQKSLATRTFKLFFEDTNFLGR